MLRPLFVVLLLTTSIGAHAQTAGGPPIAYVKRLSNGDEIHLVSGDGSERLRVYKAKSKIQITMLDLRPGGGEVAFLENYYSLKVLAFDDLGRPLPGNPREIRRVSSPCTVESPDYHPSNGSLLFVEGCARNRAVWTLQSGASQRDPTPVISTAVFRARWSRLGDSIYYVGLRDGAGTSDPVYIYRHSVGGATEELGPTFTFSTFDVGRTGERVFWTGSGDTFQAVDFQISGTTTADAVTLDCPRGMRMAYSPGDNQIAYTTSASKGGNYLMVQSASCATPFALTGKGSWGWVDWRP